MYLTQLCILCYWFISATSLERNNVCKTFKDYYIQDTSPNCWYNPDVTANATELITRHGYSVEVYKTTTEDFYILTIFRIPPKNKESRGIVFLQHPSGSSATVWIDLGKKSFAFILANYGFDVWMGNFRGTMYSLEHVYLSYEEDSNKYWNFRMVLGATLRCENDKYYILTSENCIAILSGTQGSLFCEDFHEMGLYDTPAMFEVAMKITGYKEKMYYIGHSVATTTAVVYASSLPLSAANYIKLFILWSPLAVIRHVESPVKVLRPLVNVIWSFTKLTHYTGIAYNDPIHKLVERLCFPRNVKLCADILQLVVGPDPNHFSPERFPIMIYQNLAGVSLKGLTHYTQIYNARGRFQWYDYGRAKNEYYYHSEQPPLYPIENINVPMYLIYGGNDYFTIEKDVWNLYSKLRDTIRYGILKVDVFNHVDFIYAEGIVDMLYKPTLEIIERMRNDAANR